MDKKNREGRRQAGHVDSSDGLYKPKSINYPGTVILPHAVVNTDTVVEKGMYINLAAVVDHGCIIEEGVHICLGAIVKGENRVKTLSKIEAGEVIEARKWH